MPVLEHDLVDERIDERLPAGHGGRFYGVYPALVTDVADPDGQGRVKIELPWAPGGDEAYQAWARMATLAAGPGRGTWWIPDPGDEVLVVFEGGDPRRPYVVGSLWNGQDAPPADMDAGGENNKKVLRSRSGIQVTFDDTSGAEVLRLETPGGHTLVLDDGAREIELQDSSGNVVRTGPSGISIESASKVTVQASAVEVTASTVTVNAGMSKFSGVVQADTVITNSVVSASYTPGAGNIW